MMQIIKFAIIGLSATAIHYITALICVEIFNLNVLTANACAYVGAVSCSYIGHTYVTFQTTHSKKNASKFIVASVIAFLLSQVLLHFFTNFTHLNHRLTFIFIVLSIPAFSFFINKFWVYR